MKKVKEFPVYTSTHPNAIATYHASNVVLAGHSNVSCLYKSKTRSRAVGHFFVSNNTEYPSNNGSVLTVAKTINTAMSSTTEAELGDLFINCCKSIPAHQSLKEMGHKQPPTPMQTFNMSSFGFVTNNISSKHL